MAPATTVGVARGPEKPVGKQKREQREGNLRRVAPTRLAGDATWQKAVGICKAQQRLYEKDDCMAG